MSSCQIALGGPGPGVLMTGDVRYGDYGGGQSWHANKFTYDSPGPPRRDS